MTKIKNLLNEYYVNRSIKGKDTFKELAESQVSQEDFDLLLEELVDLKDGVLLSRVFYLGFLLNLFNDSHKVILCEFIKAAWHKKHEDIALLLQFDIKHSCVESVSVAMHLELDYMLDKGDAFIRKCAYVLGDLGTEESIAKLKELSTSENELIKKYCSYQLERLGLM